MRETSLCTQLVFAASIVFAVCSQAQIGDDIQPATSTVTNPRPLIREVLDERQLAVLKGSTHPLARPEFDLGTAPASLPMQRMLLVLKRSTEQEAALRNLLDDQQDKRSPNYHKWLTPEQFGKKFGPTDADLAIITSWLQSHGFQVSPTQGRTVLEFSGSASQVREAFHTAVHKYVINGEQHWANAQDQQIPAALTPAVAGVFTLHNFLKKPQLHLSEHPAAAHVVGNGKERHVTFPAQNGQPTTDALGPQDYATIYNINPTYNTSVDGSGITIGVVGRSNLFNASEDVGDFRNYAFGLCCGNFQVILNGPDPGDLGGGEEAEATLDSTWSGAVAKGATIDLVVSASTNTTDGVDLSELYIIENNLADVMTESFGSCEYLATDAELSGVRQLAEQAAAQGISYFVSTGDNGAEGCDDPSAPPATNPVSVNLLASTSFNVAVGGTMFNENGQNTKYWGSTPPISETALSYIPEDVWNESTLTSGLWAGSGGASAGNIQNGGTTPGVVKPSWQSGSGLNIPTDGVRDLPDVSLTAAGHDPYLLCLEGSCLPVNGELFIYFVSGTSASTPSFAGIMALVDQQMMNLNPAQGPRQGQPNYVIYRLAASQISNAWQCNGSSSLAVPDVNHCIFNDTTIGNNAVPGEMNYGTTAAQYRAGTGYDLATGLGSVNVANLVTNWNSGAFNPTTTTLVLNNNNPVSITHGQPVSVGISVSPVNGTTIPTGDVSLLSGYGLGYQPQNAITDYMLTGGAANFSTDDLPGSGLGTYNVWAHYAGDAIYAPSDSNMVSVQVSQEGSTTAMMGAFTLDQFGQWTVPISTPLSFGTPVYIAAAVSGTSGLGTPTGIVDFSANGGMTIPNSNSPSLNSQGIGSVQSNRFLLNGPTIPFDAGQYTISANYVGDASFQPSTSAQNPNSLQQWVTFTVTPGFFASVASNQAGISVSAPGSSGSTSMTLVTSTGFNGTISLSCSGLPSEAQCLFSPSSVKGAGIASTTASKITVTTMAAHTTQRDSERRYYLAHLLTGGGLVLASVFFGFPKGRRFALPLLLIVLTLLAPACGGGGSAQVVHQQDPGTPTGTYNVIVTANGGAVTSTTGFLLIIQ